MGGACTPRERFPGGARAPVLAKGLTKRQRVRKPERVSTRGGFADSRGTETRSQARHGQSGSRLAPVNAPFDHQNSIPAVEIANEYPFLALMGSLN